MTPKSTPTTLPPALRHADGVLLAALVAAAGAGSLLVGQDANWDMLNYHYYNPWAWWNGRTFGRDIAAAQIQTFYNPILDLPFFAMVTAQWPPRLISFILALPAALAAFFVCKLALLLFARLPRMQRMVAVACSVAIGATSAMGIGALGNTMNEWPLTALVLFALWWVARAIVRADGHAVAIRPLVIAGTVAGLAAGAKLTTAMFAVGMCVALLLRGPRSAFPARLREASWLAAGVAVGIAVAYGPWGYALWTHFDNPVFPYANQWFRSEWWEPRAVPGHAFGPKSVVEWPLFPFELLSPPTLLVAEVPYRDARIPLLWALALVGIAAWIARSERASSESPGVRDAWRVVALFAASSLFVWTLLYSIYRYLLPLDALTGILIAGILWKLSRPRFATAACVAATVILVASTSFANWGRVPFGDRWFEVKVPMPPVQPDALVLITTGEAVSYFIPMLPPTSRYVGALNTLLAPEQRNRLASTVRDVVREHRGMFYQLTFPLTEGREAIATYGLARTTACAVIVNNMPTSPLELCILVRKPATP